MPLFANRGDLLGRRDVFHKVIDHTGPRPVVLPGQQILLGIELFTKGIELKKDVFGNKFDIGTCFNKFNPLLQQIELAHQQQFPQSYRSILVQYFFVVLEIQFEGVFVNVFKDIGQCQCGTQTVQTIFNVRHRRAMKFFHTSLEFNPLDFNTVLAFHLLHQDQQDQIVWLNGKGFDERQQVVTLDESLLGIFLKRFFQLIVDGQFAFFDPGNRFGLGLFVALLRLNGMFFFLESGNVLCPGSVHPVWLFKRSGVPPSPSFLQSNFSYVS